MFSIIFITLFSYSTSFLYPKIVGFDSSFYQLVGRGMIEGLLPYRDFFEIKGPFMFFIQCIGNLISKEYGVFLLQIINLFLICYCLLKIVKILNPEISDLSILTVLLFSLSFLFIVYDEGNLTKEYCLSLNLICLLLYVENSNGADNLKLLSFFLGLSFVLIVLIRITNAITVCSIQCILFLSSIYFKQKKILLIIFYFFMGCTIAALPILIYCFIHGIMYEMIYCAFIFAFSYVTENTSIFSINYLFIIPLLVLPFLYRKNTKLLILVILSLFGNTAILSLGNNYLHYYIMLFPLYGLLFLSLFSEFKAKTFILLSFTLICIMKNIIVPISYFADRILNQKNGLVVRYDAGKEIGEKIAKGSTVFSYGVDSDFYLINDIFPDNKYIFWIDHFIELSSDIECEVVEYL